ncbi:MAG: HlyD family efflux transporter periplasmic adaptor subunit [Methylobacillus sp.]|jgi:HlyD family secretion protein|nr:HlyD family efflux transporter periplasmic adaptor subunit [Methylobacillus sp.]
MNASRKACVLGAALLLGSCSQAPRDTFQGYVEGEFVYMASSQSGRLDALAVARGQQVAANAPLFRLESADETAARDQAAQQLAAAESQLADIKLGKRPQEIAVTREQLKQAEANAQNAAQQLARNEKLAPVGGVSKADLDAARAQADATTALVRQLRGQLVVDTLPNRKDQIGAQTAQVEAARAMLAQAEWRLAQKTVAAPKAGLVFDTLYREGEWVMAGNPVVRLLPPENIKVRFFIPQTLVGAIAPGRKVEIHCDGCAAPIPAQITFISSEAEYTPPVIYSNENRGKLMFMLEARPDATDAPKLHPGQPVEMVLK